MSRNDAAPGTVTAPPGRIRRTLSLLYVQCLIGVLGGAVVGWLWPALGAELKPLGDGFIALVRMMIAPVIFCTVVHGIASMGNARAVGRVSLRALIYFEILTTVAMVIGLVVVNIVKPGSGLDVDPSTLSTEGLPPEATESHDSVSAFVLSVIPDTLPSALTSVVGNGVATLAVAKWEGQLDEGRAKAVLRGELPYSSAPETHPAQEPKGVPRPQDGPAPDAKLQAAEAAAPKSAAGSDRAPVPTAG